MLSGWTVPPVLDLFKMVGVRGRRSGAPWKIRTSDLLIRSQTLYPAELRAHLVGLKNYNKENGIVGGWGGFPAHPLASERVMRMGTQILQRTVTYAGETTGGAGTTRSLLWMAATTASANSLVLVWPPISRVRCLPSR